jgi:predicted polyphosphate/ATP-dependent NAD kinase
MEKTLGLIINPIAGMGGRVGLKGTDGDATLHRALALGAVPRAQERAREALRPLSSIKNSIHLLSCPGEMGIDLSRSLGFTPHPVAPDITPPTSAADTRRAACAMRAAGADLILFVGGDGTARDMFEALGEGGPVLGIPAGVKVLSAVFSINPREGGELATRFLMGRVREVRSCEVVDVDEEAYREGRLSSRLCGYLPVPFEAGRVQPQKARSSGPEKVDQEAIACEITERMQEDELYILGPGTTTRAVLRALGIQGTLLGVDAVLNGELVAADVGESRLLDLMRGQRTRLIVTPVGGQGMVLGRGNLQISPRVLDGIQSPDIWIVATPAKINALRGMPLRVDTGDLATDLRLSGYYRVITGSGEEVVYKVTR